MVCTDHLQRWMQPQARSGQQGGGITPTGNHRGWQGICVRGMAGLHSGELKARHVGQIGQVLCRLEARKPTSQAGAVARQNRRGGRIGADVRCGHRSEELVADKLLHHRESVAECIYKRNDHVVAVDVEAPHHIAAIPGPQPGWRHAIGVQQRGHKAGLEGRVHAASDCAMATSCAAHA